MWYQCAHTQETYKWSCKIACTLPNEILNIHVSCWVVKCGLLVINEPVMLIVPSLSAITGAPGPPSNSQLSQPFQNLECHQKHVDFFIQASPYIFFYSQYDSSGFLFDLTRNFRLYCCSHISNIIFSGEVHHWLICGDVVYKPLNCLAQNSDYR